MAGTIGSKQDAVDYLTWTFFFRRLLQNPSYYDLDSTASDAVNVFLSRMVEDTLAALQVGDHALQSAKSASVRLQSSVYYCKEDACVEGHQYKVI